MNIFYLDHDPKKAAQYHCDKHVVKMILEYCQILSTAHHGTGQTTVGLYKATHKNHPSTLWAQASKYHYQWLYVCLCSLIDEWHKRYHHPSSVPHKSERLLPLLKKAPKSLPNTPFHPPPPVIARKELITADIVESYRNYYRNEKYSFATWKTETPSWFTIKND